MFLYFPKNYVWSASVSIAMENGGKIGEIEEICRPLLEVADSNEDNGTEAWFERWTAKAEQLVELAAEDEAKGRLYSAGAKLKRAGVYFLTGERMQKHGFEKRAIAYAKGRNAFFKGATLYGEKIERVEIPYKTGVIAGYLLQADNVEGKQPILIHINGLDSLKEMLYCAGWPAALAKRGVASLVIDQPGTGETLRLHGLHAEVETENWASVVVDYLETRADVDPKRIGIMGVSLGGYYTPRAVAFEPRFAAGGVWGANHNWGEMQKRRLSREGDRPVPHYWEHVRWVWGAENQEDFMALAERIHLNGILDRVTVPFLVTHGGKDRQIPVEYAQQTYDQLTNSPRRELKIFTDREGGVQHSSIDNMANAGEFIVDWFAEVLGGHTRA